MSASERGASRYGREMAVVARGEEGRKDVAFRVAYPRTYARPDPTMLKRALRAYVRGHDRGWEAERKRREAEAELEREAVGRDARRGGSAEAAPVAPARFGVPVPERLDFHRGPDVWRDRGGRGRPAAEEGPPGGEREPADG